MDIGVFIFDTDYSIDIGELARELEDRGYESLFVPEHTHIPASRRSPFPGGGELPRQYSHTLDPFISLSFAAAATTKLKIGTGICLLPQRDPIITAKLVASLDLMSKGRFVLGLGGGWNMEEMENHGVSYNTRFAMMREHVLAMKSLWAREDAEFSGDYVSFDKSWSYPKPLQKPHPPILLGGETDYTLRRVVEYCDGWFPRGRGGFDAVESIGRLKKMADEEERDINSLSISVFGAPVKPDVVDDYRRAGINRALFALPSDNRDKVMESLDDFQPLVDLDS